MAELPFQVKEANKKNTKKNNRPTHNLSGTFLKISTMGFFFKEDSDRPNTESNEWGIHTREFETYCWATSLPAYYPIGAIV